MFSSFRVLSLVGVGLCVSMISVQSQIIFSGTDSGATSTDPRPLSNAAAASFDAAAGLLGSFTTLTFESSPVGTFTSLMPLLGVTLTGTGGFGGDQSVRNSPFHNLEARFGYNTTMGGQNFVYINGGSLTFTFDQPIQAFGAYISGVQHREQTIQYSNGSVQSIMIPTPLPLANGGIAFAGFTDAGALISSVTISTQTSSFPLGDLLGVDDVRFVLASPSTVPEPGSVALLVGMASISGMMVRRRRNNLPT